MTETVRAGLKAALASAAAAFRVAEPYPWCAGETLFGARLAHRAWQELQGLPWRRAETDFYRQWECRVDRAPLVQDSLLAEVVAAGRQASLGEVVPDAGGLELDAVVAHRLQEGDAMDVHNDANPYGELVRLVWMVGPAPSEGGAFVVCETTGRPIVEIPFAADAWVCFRLGPDSHHSVPRVGEGEARSTLVFTWRRR